MLPLIFYGIYEFPCGILSNFKVFRKYFYIGPDCTGITACSSSPCRQNEKCTPIGSSYECEKDISKYLFRSIENR